MSDRFARGSDRGNEASKSSAIRVVYFQIRAPGRVPDALRCAKVAIEGGGAARMLRFFDCSIRDARRGQSAGALSRAASLSIKD
jgi:hypothetical protein